MFEGFRLRWGIKKICKIRPSRTADGRIRDKRKGEVIMVGRKEIIISFILVLLFSGSVIPVFARETPRFIREGDEYFNRGQYRLAREQYRLGWDDAEKNGRKDLLFWISNNIAATYMAAGDLENFSKYFAFGKKVRIAPAEKSTRDREGNGENLLVNGGFEEGLAHPWGTGHYERTDGKFRFGTWWNSKNAKAFMKMDTVEKHAGNMSLRITNYSQFTPHVFTTVSQRISGLEPNSVYRISFYAKAQNLESGVYFAIDAAWVKRFLRIKSGTYDWEFYTGEINIGHTDYIDFRIIHENAGTAWLDDIEIRKVRPGEEENLVQRVESLFDLARYEDAREICNTMVRQYPDKMGIQRTVRLFLGRIQLIYGNYDRAIENFHWLVNNGYPRANIDLGDVYYTLGAYEKATLFYKKSLDIVRGDQGTTSLVLNKLGSNYLAGGNLEKALETQERSLFVLEHIGDKHGQAKALMSLGMIHARGEDYSSAANRFSLALELLRDIDDQKLLSEIYYHRAFVSYLSGDVSGAKGPADSAQRIQERIKDEKGRIHTLHLQGLIRFSERKYREALVFYREAVSILESLYVRAGEASPETRAQFLGQFSRLYRDYVDLLLLLHQRQPEKGYDKEAFRGSEQARSRVFTEMINHSRVMKTFIETSKDEPFTGLIREEHVTWLKIQALERSLARLFNQPDFNGGAAKKSIELQLTHMQEQYLALQARLEREYPRYAELKRTSPLNIEDIQKLLTDDEALLGFFVTGNRTGVWALTNRKHRLAVLDVGRELMIQRTRNIRKAFPSIVNAVQRMGKKDSITAVKDAFALYDVHSARLLYQELVEPVEDLLKGKSLVYVAPDDVLYQLPFEALLTGEYVGESENGAIMGSGLKTAPFWTMKQSLAYLPSASILRLLRSLQKPGSTRSKPLIAFADPDFTIEGSSREIRGITRGDLLEQLGRSGAIARPFLPGLPDTREEALFIAEVLGASREDDVYLGRDASEYNVKRLPLKESRYLLFATHGLIAGEFKPGIQPSLAMSFVGDPENDGLLEMGEILGLDLQSDMTVLSACNTARGVKSEDRGEGFAGLTLSFMFAGAESLLVTLWSVESGTSKILMQSTFQSLLTRSRAAALAEAKRMMIRSGKNLKLTSRLGVSIAHPFFWAPYILVGEGK